MFSVREVTLPFEDGPGARRCAAVANDGDRYVFMYGGCSGFGVPLRDLWAFDIEEETWLCLMPEDRSYKSLVMGEHLDAPIEVQPSFRPPGLWMATLSYFQGSLFLYGGSMKETEGQEKVSDQFWKFDIEQRQWGLIEASGDTPPGMWCHSASVIGVSGKLIIYGGSAIGVPVTSSIFWCSLLDEKPTWEKTQAGEFARESHAACVAGELVYVYGGMTHGVEERDEAIVPAATLLRIDTSVRPFRTVELPVHAHAAQGHSLTFEGETGRLILFGGETEVFADDRDRERCNDVVMFDSSLPDFPVTRLTTEQLPSLAFMITSQIGKKIFIHGGQRTNEGVSRSTYICSTTREIHSLRSLCLLAVVDTSVLDANDAAAYDALHNQNAVRQRQRESQIMYKQMVTLLSKLEKRLEDQIQPGALSGALTCLCTPAHLSAVFAALTRGDGISVQQIFSIIFSDAPDLSEKEMDLEDQYE